MLVIRFFRTGKKNQPFFKIVVTDKRKAPRGGRFNAEVGFWNPLTKEKSLNKEKIKYWLSVGAKPSDRVHNLLVEDKIIEDKKISVHKKKKVKAGAETPKTATPKAEAPKTEAPKAETPKAEASKAEAPKVEAVKPETKPAEPVIPVAEPTATEVPEAEQPKEKPKKVSEPKQQH